MLKDCLGINWCLLDLLVNVVGWWGIEVDVVEIKDVDIFEQMQWVIVCEVEVICEKCVCIIKVEGENEVVQKLVEVVKMIGSVLGVLELWCFQMFSEIGVEYNSMIIVMLLVELFYVVQKLVGLLFVFVD